MLVVASPGPLSQAFFEFLKTSGGGGGILYEYFSFSSTWDNWAPKFKTTRLLQIAAESFKLLLHFLSKGPHKTTLTLGFLKIEILTNFTHFR